MHAASLRVRLSTIDCTSCRLRASAFQVSDAVVCRQLRPPWCYEILQIDSKAGSNPPHAPVSRKESPFILLALPRSTLEGPSQQSLTLRPLWPPCAR
jgi:hypothetical protein